VGAPDEAAGTLLPPILALLDVPVDDAGWVALDPRERRQRTLDACRHLLVRESRVQPVLLIFEDLYWVDSETQAFLDALLEALACDPILLLASELSARVPSRLEQQNILSTGKSSSPCRANRPRLCSHRSSAQPEPHPAYSASEPRATHSSSRSVYARSSSRTLWSVSVVRIDSPPTPAGYAYRPRCMPSSLRVLTGSLPRTRPYYRAAAVIGKEVPRLQRRTSPIAAPALG
jgi:hypothetical protein